VAEPGAVWYDPLGVEEASRRVMDLTLYGEAYEVMPPLHPDDHRRLMEWHEAQPTRLAVKVPRVGEYPLLSHDVAAALRALRATIVDVRTLDDGVAEVVVEVGP
jgi:hypothetical protein